MHFRRSKKQEQVIRLHITIRGAVQGVGFRPFVHALATRLGLRGTVENGTKGVSIDIEGPRSAVDRFRTALERDKPPHAVIHEMNVTEDTILVRHTDFQIVESDPCGDKTVVVLPDLATCPECLSEILDRGNRRYHYPFTNCTHCGPRFSIITGLPYDRPNTTMGAFTMCPACKAEYNNPDNRRFHAQPIACPDCGPHLWLTDRTGKLLAEHDVALLAACTALRAGCIVAVKGIGGFQLLVDARNEAAVLKLRERKARPDKAFAVMFPNLINLEHHCALSGTERDVLMSAAAPIVLLERMEASDLARAVAPGSNPYTGAMIPYTPLHHLILMELGFPIICTSGNVTDEPMVKDNDEATTRLGRIADLFLMHNRDIVRIMDDSVVYVEDTEVRVMRAARGYAPLSFPVEGGGRTVLATGAHQKVTVALAHRGQITGGQHLGDQGSVQADRAFKRAVQDMVALRSSTPDVLAHDLHPSYTTTRWAREQVHYDQPHLVAVQHHIAHVRSCLAENEHAGPALGVAFDGTGYGLDGTIWGGEFLTVTSDHIKRVAHLRTFPLPGGDKTSRDSYRCTLGLLWELGLDTYGDQVIRLLEHLSCADKTLLLTMLARGINTPRTSSMGRLFDAVAALLGLRHTCTYEGQAAMELEWSLRTVHETGQYPLSRMTCNIHGSVGVMYDWAPMVHALLEDQVSGVETCRIAARFHNTVASMVVEEATHHNLETVALSGGCFQNRYLLRETIKRLKKAGLRPLWHKRVPTNDGGISIGQIAYVSRLET